MGKYVGKVLLLNQMEKDLMEFLMNLVVETKSKFMILIMTLKILLLEILKHWGIYVIMRKNITMVKSRS